MTTNHSDEKNPARGGARVVDGFPRQNRWTMSEAFVKPGSHSKGSIERAGKAMAQCRATEEDERIVQYWRDCHAYVLNTFQGTLRRWIRDSPYVLVQRLKRLNTVRDKLQTGRSKDIASMHDLAGCRIIFPSVHDLHAYRKEFHSKTRAQHEYVSKDRYDYLTNPKPTGYRGMHDVFRYKVGAGPGDAWNGLRVEIQYRTQAQHAWATAVEISDLIDHSRVKFVRGSDLERERLFVLASEHIARNAEGMRGAVPNISDSELLSELQSIEQSLGVFSRLRAVSASEVLVPNSKNLVLTFSDQLTIDGFRSARQAMEQRNYIELFEPDKDVVYIRAEKPSEVANAFRNYFRDAKAFISLLP